MKVLFIIPRRKYISGDVPLGVCSLAAYLKQEFQGMQIKIIDCNVMGQDPQAIEDALKGEMYDLAGISLDTLSFKNGMSLVPLAKKHSKYLVVGGPHITAMPESVFPTKEIDAAVPGDGEYKLKKIIESLSSGKRPELIPGIYFNAGEKWDYVQDDAPHVDLNGLPMPDRSLINMDFYIRRMMYFDAFDVNTRGTTLIASRGCPFSCTYCQPLLSEHFGRKIRFRSPESVADEIARLNSEYKINAFFFHDDTMTLNKSWLLKLCGLIRDLKRDIIWGCNSRVDTFQPELVEVMVASGLKKVHLGIESGSQRVLDEVYHKGTNLDQVREAVELGKKHKLYMLGFFMLGAPDESMEEMRWTISLARRLKIDEASFSIFTPIPGSALWKSLQGEMRNQNFDFEELNYYAGHNLAVNKEISPSRIRKLQLYALIAFYLHPAHISYILRHFTSFNGIRRLVIKLKRVAGL